MIYADNAATSKLDPQALDAMMPYLKDVYGNPSQPYSFSRESKAALRKSREIIAKCINADPQEIYFTSGGTESDNWALKGLCDNIGGRNTIVTSAIEHHAILKTCDSLKNRGYKIQLLQPDSSGVISPSELSSHLSKDVGIVSVMMANNEIGTIEPIKELASMAHECGAVFHTDAVQAMGHIKIDVKDLGVDLLSASAHKFNGPRGVGFLYVKKGTKLSPLHNGGSQESNMRAGTENIPGIVGMAIALNNNCELIQSSHQHLIQLENQLLSKLKTNAIDFKINGNRDFHLPGLVSLSFPNKEGEMILHRLDLKHICISTGSACDAGREDISHVLKAIKLEKTYAKGTIRISLSKDNTDSEIDIICDELSSIIRS